jgi:DNA-binding MarR family transcriptional regulator
MRTAAVPDPAALRLTIAQFWDSFPPVWNHIREHLRDAVLPDRDLTIQQFHVLRYVRQGTVSVSDLASARRISRPAMSQAVDGLVHKGLIRRCQSGDDRRYVPLALTQKGNELLDAIVDQNRAWMAQRLARLTPRELDCIQRGLKALAQAFDGPDE